MFKDTEDLSFVLREAIKPSLCSRAQHMDYVQTVLDVKEILEELQKMGRCEIVRVAKRG